MMSAFRHVLPFLACICACIAWSQEATDAIQPEGTSTGTLKLSGTAAEAQAAKAAARPVEAQDWMVVAANPLAVEAGAQILAQGGTAADAMIAVQAVLGLVEPQSSGLGGGAFLVWYDATSGAITTLDARETAPLEATPQLFQDENGKPLDFFDAVVGGRSVGVPGVPALLAEAHVRWGKTRWSGLFSEAIRLADLGFTVSPRMATMVARDAERLAQFDTTNAYFLPDGSPLVEGTQLTNPAYANTLRILANQGPEPFYSGEIARDIVETVRSAKGNPGVLSGVDLAIYRVKERNAVCAPYRGHNVCGMGPPSSGALTVGQILGMLNDVDIEKLSPNTPDTWRLIGDATRLAFADRGLFMADNDYVPVPIKGLLDPTYLGARARLLGGTTALINTPPGKPKFDHSFNYISGKALERPSTTHISIVDSSGNALSMTSTIENAFGSRLMVRGFLLNNELTDFSAISHRNGVPVANRVEPGKRPRSSMAPTIVLKDGKPVLVLGSPGGSRIIPYVAKTIIAHIDWGLDVQKAVSLPHLTNRFGIFDIEQGTSVTGLASRLEAIGYEVKFRDLTSGLHAISIGDTLLGGADPRREGIALGQ